MASDYDGLTVAELKGLLRDRGLPVSGAKAILLDRLEARMLGLPENNQPSPAQTHPSPSTVEGKKARVRFKCRACGVLLAVPADHTGVVECPACRTQQPVGTSNASEGVSVRSDSKSMVRGRLTVRGGDWTAGDRRFRQRFFLRGHVPRRESNRSRTGR